MKYLTFFLVLLFTAFVYTGCQDAMQDITSPSSGTSSMQKEISFSGSADGMTNAPGGMNMPYRHFEGTGTSSLTNGECTIILDYWALPNGTSILGRGKIIAANGNELYSQNIAGTWSMNGTTVTFTCSGDIAGGTGQFINAIGTLSMSGTLDGVTRVTHGEWTGTLRHARPFSGSMSGVNLTITDPPCGSGYIRRAAECTGNALHFGEFTCTLSHCLNMANGLVMGGNGIIADPSGQSITLNYIGYVTPKGNNLYDVILMGKIVSGTGRFADAQGSIIAYAVQNMATGEVSGTMNGAMDY